MTAIATIKTSGILGLDHLTSSATVSVDATYDPEGQKAPGVYSWVDRSGGVPVNYPRFTLSVRPPTKGSRVYKVTAKLAIPTAESVPQYVVGVPPAPAKAYECTAVLEFLLPERSTLAERTKLFSQLKGLLCASITASDQSPTDNTGTPMYAAVYNFDPPY